MGLGSFAGGVARGWQDAERMVNERERLKIAQDQAAQEKQMRDMQIAEAKEAKERQRALEEYAASVDQRALQVGNTVPSFNVSGQQTFNAGAAEDASRSITDTALEAKRAGLEAPQAPSASIVQSAKTYTAQDFQKDNADEAKRLRVSGVKGAMDYAKGALRDRISGLFDEAYASNDVAKFVAASNMIPDGTQVEVANHPDGGMVFKYGDKQRRFNTPEELFASISPMAVKDKLDFAMRGNQFKLAESRAAEQAERDRLNAWNKKRELDIKERGVIGKLAGGSGKSGKAGDESATLGGMDFKEYQSVLKDLPPQQQLQARNLSNLLLENNPEMSKNPDEIVRLGMAVATGEYPTVDAVLPDGTVAKMVRSGGTMGTYYALRNYGPGPSKEAGAVVDDKKITAEKAGWLRANMPQIMANPDTRDTFEKVSAMPPQQLYALREQLMRTRGTAQYAQNTDQQGLLRVVMAVEHARNVPEWNKAPAAPTPPMRFDAGVGRDGEVDVGGGTVYGEFDPGTQR